MASEAILAAADPAVPSAADKQRHLAERDSPTGPLNRRAMTEVLALQRLRRGSLRSTPALR